MDGSGSRSTLPCGSAALQRSQTGLMAWVLAFSRRSWAAGRRAAKASGQRVQVGPRTTTIPSPPTVLVVVAPGELAIGIFPGAPQPPRGFADRSRADPHPPDGHSARSPLHVGLQPLRTHAPEFCRKTDLRPALVRRRSLPHKGSSPGGTARGQDRQHHASARSEPSPPPSAPRSRHLRSVPGRQPLRCLRPPSPDRLAAEVPLRPDHRGCGDLPSPGCSRAVI